MSTEGTVEGTVRQSFEILPVQDRQQDVPTGSSSESMEDIDQNRASEGTAFPSRKSSNPHGENPGRESRKMKKTPVGEAEENTRLMKKKRRDAGYNSLSLAG